MICIGFSMIFHDFPVCMIDGGPDVRPPLATRRPWGQAFRIFTSDNHGSFLNHYLIYYYIL